MCIRDSIPGHRGQIGGGASVAGIGQVFTQGALESTGVNTDLAILGQGFFVLEDESGQRSYSRAGQFDMDNTGYMRSMSGETLMGYLADTTGQVGTTLSPLAIGLEDLAPQPTSNIAVTGNLDATAEEIDPTLLWSSGQLPVTYDDATGPVSYTHLTLPTKA